MCGLYGRPACDLGSALQLKLYSEEEEVVKALCQHFRAFMAAKIMPKSTRAERVMPLRKL